MLQKVVFNNSEVDQILNLGQDWFDSKVTKKGTGGEGYLDNNDRLSLECNLDVKKVESIVLPKLVEHDSYFHSKVKSLTGQAILLKYNKGHFFRRHQDRIEDNPIKSKRIQTIIIQLSDGDDYVGGDLLVGCDIADRIKGNLIIFESTRYHELTELISGTRHCLVTWVTSKDYKKLRLI